MSHILYDHLPEGTQQPHLTQLVVMATDERGPGNANHQYVIEHGELPSFLTINFQCGPIKEVGVNGVTNEALLAVLIDRLHGFQSSPYACMDNERALRRLKEAMALLHQRTRERTARGVEGTHNV